MPGRGNTRPDPDFSRGRLIINYWHKLKLVRVLGGVLIVLTVLPVISWKR